MMQSHFNVLFLCTGNSARSIMAEAILNAKGQPIFSGYSAGSHPVGRIHSGALKQLEASHISTAGLRSKSWDEFELSSAPQFDLILTVCDNAAMEVCPVWPGHPITAHWGMPDPAVERTSADAAQKAFSDAFRTLERRITLLLNLPMSKLNDVVLSVEMNDIGRR